MTATPLRDHLTRTHQPIPREPLARLVYTTHRDPVAVARIIHAKGRSPGDKRTLRGIPVIALGVSGTMPGTDPIGATLNREKLRTPEQSRCDRRQ